MSIHRIVTWQARIHIGRWTDPAAWKRSVEGKAREWLRHMPKRIRGLDMQAPAIRCWQTAGLLLGLTPADASVWIQNNALLLGTAPLPEAALLAYALKKRDALSETDQNRIRARIIQSKGTLPYRPSCPEIRFVDTIGMICPFLYAVGMDEWADRQIEEYDAGLYANTFPPHAYHLERELPLGVYDWGRGTGWYVLGLIESDRNEERILQLAERLLPLQKEDGSFGCFLFDPSSCPESSGSALMGLLMVRAWELGGGDLFLSAAMKSEQSLMKMTRRDGTVDYAQGDTMGIGNYSRHFGIMPFAQGMTLLLANRLASLFGTA